MSAATTTARSCAHCGVRLTRSTQTRFCSVSCASRAAADRRAEADRRAQRQRHRELLRINPLPETPEEVEAFVASLPAVEDDDDNNEIEVIIMQVTGVGRSCDNCGRLHLPEERVRFGEFAYCSPECRVDHEAAMRRFVREVASDPDGPAGFEIGEEVGPR